MKFLHKFVFFMCLIFTCLAKNKTNDKISKRIIGGKVSSINKIGGYLVALRYDGEFLCGGSYVSTRIVVSAAHCISDLMDSVGLLTVQGGISNLKEESQQIKVEKAVIPSNYNKIQNDLDVAVLLLKSPLKGNAVKQIKLCTHGLKSRDMVKVSGWGLIDPNDLRNVNQVRSIEIPVMDKVTCKKTFTRVAEITDAMICAGIPNQKDACQYDSGGPLVHKNELCGIVSFGVNCASEFPGVYADVKILSSWIKETIRKLLS